MVVKTKLLLLVPILVALLSANLAMADSRSASRRGGAQHFALNLTLGETAFRISKKLYRGPFSLELMPSMEMGWLTVDLGLLTALEKVHIANTELGNWGITLRPGGRLTPPPLPVYLRIAFPLQFQAHNFDWGVLFGLGTDLRIFKNIGIVLELDSTLSKALNWGRLGMPWEFRAGLSFHF